MTGLEPTLGKCQPQPDTVAWLIAELQKHDPAMPFQFCLLDTETGQQSLNQLGSIFEYNGQVRVQIDGFVLNGDDPDSEFNAGYHDGYSAGVREARVLNVEDELN